MGNDIHICREGRGGRRGEEREGSGEIRGGRLDTWLVQHYSTRYRDYYLARGWGREVHFEFDR